MFLAALIFAVLVGVFTAAPSFVFLKQVGSDYKEVWPAFDGDSLYYFARIGEILDGQKSINHPYFAEHKEEPYPQASAGEYFVAYVSKLLNTIPPIAQIWFDLFGSMLIFLLLFYFFRIFNPYHPILAVVLPFLFVTVITGGFFKPIHSQISFPLLILFLILWAHAVLHRKRGAAKIICAGIILGFLFLTYFYHWSFVVVILGVYAILEIFRRNYREVFRSGWILLIGIIVGLPYFYSVWAGLSAPNHAETMVRVGVYFSHLPETLPRLAVAIVWLASFVSVSWRYRLLGAKDNQILLTFLIANIIYPNHQIISGMIIQNANHWSWMPVFIYLLTGSYLIGKILASNERKSGKILITSIVCMLMIIPSARLSSFHFSWKRHLSGSQDYYLNIQRYGGLFSWINNNTKKGSVFLSDFDLMGFIPAYTHANVYYHTYAFNLPGSDLEIVERALISRIFEPEFYDDPHFGMTVDNRILWTQPAQTERNTHKIYDILGLEYEKKYDLRTEVAYVNSVLTGLGSDRYSINLLGKYRLDYIVWDKKTKQNWNLDVYPELELVFEEDGIAAYKLKK